MRRSNVVASMLGLLVAAGIASAGTVRVTKYVSQYSWDEQPVRGVVGDAPAGWSGQSWQGPSTGKTNFYLTTADLQAAFGDDTIELGQIAKISFNTKRDTGDESDHLFFLSLYTQTTGSDDSASWYKSRLTLNPQEGAQVNDVWQLWSSDDAESSTSQLRIEDSPRFGYGTFGDVGPWTISGRDYSTELFGSLAIGTDSLDNGNNTYVDGLIITLTDGSTGEFDFQAVVPLPSTAGLSLAGLGLVTLRRRR